MAWALYHFEDPGQGSLAFTAACLCRLLLPLRKKAWESVSGGGGGDLENPGPQRQLLVHSWDPPSGPGVGPVCSGEHRLLAVQGQPRFAGLNDQSCIATLYVHPRRWAVPGPFVVLCDCGIIQDAFCYWSSYLQFRVMWVFFHWNTIEKVIAYWKKHLIMEIIPRF